MQVSGHFSLEPETVPVKGRWNRGDSPVLVMHDGVTKSIFAHLIPVKGVDFPICEKVVKMIVKDLDTLGYHRVVFRRDNEPSTLALLRAVKLAWTGDVVQERSTDGDPQSNVAAESSVNVVKGCQINQTGTTTCWHAPSVCSASRWQDSIRTKRGKARCSLLGAVR